MIIIIVIIIIIISSSSSSSIVRIIFSLCKLFLFMTIHRTKWQ